MNDKKECRIFLVDDDPFCQAMYEQQLNNLGFTNIVVYASGKELLQHLNENPNLVVLDYNLEDYKGIELLQKIKLFNSDITVIIVSGQVDIFTEKLLIEKGALDYIHKGDNEMEKLTEVITNWCTAQRKLRQKQLHQ